MGYTLGVDLGTTYAAAATSLEGTLEIAELGTRSATVPSVVFLREDGSMLTGEAAARRGSDDPVRLARNFKRRMGDTTPLLLGETPFGADALMARQLQAVVATVAERHGGSPDAIAVAHPANWGPYKRDLLRQSIVRADLDRVVLVTEPHAAALHYASEHPLAPGSSVAVYDLGGGTFDVAVLRATTAGFELLGEPQGIERLGGIDFDQAVFRHVTRTVGDAVASLDLDDPVAQLAMARLNDECVRAKEALSSDTEVSIPVLLPGAHTRVRLTRAEFESMIRPLLGDTVVVTNRALRSAGVTPSLIDVVLLVGGSSRIPLIAQLVANEFDRPVALDAHPKHAVALGAALFAATTATRAGMTAAGTAVPTTGPAVEPTATLPAIDLFDLPASTGAAGAPPPATAVVDPTSSIEAGPIETGPIETGPMAAEPTTAPLTAATRPVEVDVVADPSWPQPRNGVPTAGRRRALVGAAAALALLIGGGAWVLGRGGDGLTRSTSDAASESTNSSVASSETTTVVAAPAATTVATSAGSTTTEVVSAGPVPPASISDSTSTSGTSTSTPVRPTSTVRPGSASGSANPAETTSPIITPPPQTASPTIPPTVPPATAGPTVAPTDPPATSAPTTQATPALPNVGQISVSKQGSGVVIFTASSADQCGAWTWTLSGTTFAQRSGGSLTGCIGATHSWNTSWNNGGPLPDGPYTVTLTLTNTSGSRSSSQSFSMP